MRNEKLTLSFFNHRQSHIFSSFFHSTLSLYFVTLPSFFTSSLHFLSYVLIASSHSIFSPPFFLLYFLPPLSHSTLTLLFISPCLFYLLFILFYHFLSLLSLPFYLFSPLSHSSYSTCSLWILTPLSFFIFSSVLLSTFSLHSVSISYLTFSF